jgi:hypothetical protein
MAERYFNNFATTVGVGGYTAASGMLNVVSTTGITLASGDTCRLSIYRVVGGANTLIVILIASAVNSGTQFAVTAEGADANAIATDNVINTLTAGGMDQIRIDMGEPFSGALPTDSIAGDLRVPSDDIVAWINVAGTLEPFGPFQTLTAPVAGNFSWRNQGGSSATVRQGSIFLQGVAGSGPNLRLYEVSVPGSTPYSFTAGMRTLQVGAGSTNVGLCFDDGTKVVWIALSINGSSPILAVTIIRFNSVTSFSSAPVNLPIMGVAGGEVYLKVRDDGTNIYFYIGTNPFDLVLVYQEAKGAFLGTITDVGIALDCETGSSGFITATTLFHFAQGT